MGSVDAHFFHDFLAARGSGQYFAACTCLYCGYAVRRDVPTSYSHIYCHHKGNLRLYTIVRKCYSSNIKTVWPVLFSR